MTEEAPLLYLASDAGFREDTLYFYTECYKPAIQGLGYRVIDPWASELGQQLARAAKMDIGLPRLNALQTINFKMGKANFEDIKRSDGVVANLNGLEVDSGTATEVGYAFGIGKNIIGYRSDIRMSGDEGSRINLQTEYPVLASGGMITRSLKQLVDELPHFFPLTKKSA